jgi:hypothetical protein
MAAAAAQAALIQQLQSEVQTLQHAANTAPAALHPPVFTLAPALAHTAAFLDLTSPSGTKHFKGATESLTKEPFGFVNPSDLQVFLDLVLKKSQVWGWNLIFTIPVTPVATGITTDRNLLSHYGLIPIKSVRAAALTYYSNQTKQAQDSFMSCQFFAFL